MDKNQYFINQNLNKKEELVAGFVLSDFLPLLITIIIASMIRNLAILLILLLASVFLSVYLRLARLRHPPGYIMHLAYRFTGFGAVKGRIPPGDRIAPYFWE